jgi:hypothetical protein
MSEKDFDIETVTLDETNINKYLSKEFKIINSTNVFNIELVKIIGTGSFGKV